MPLSESQKAMFTTIKQAFENGDVALLDVYDKVADRQEAAICAVEWDGDEYTLKPFAIMTASHENPFERFQPPVEGGGYDTD